MKRGLALTLIGIAIVIAGGAWWYLSQMHKPVPPTTTAITDVPFSVLAEGETAKDMHTRTNYAIYDKGEFASFWKKAHGGDATQPPAVDFSQNYVIAVFGGDMPATGTARVSIEHISDSATGRTVAILLEEPASCSSSKATASPYVFVSVPFSNTDMLEHTDRVVTGTCPQS